MYGLRRGLVGCNQSSEGMPYMEPAMPQRLRLPLAMPVLKLKSRLNLT